MCRALLTTTLLLAIILLASPTTAVKTGNCTGVYLETAPNHIPGLVQPGDVFEYWCELPARVSGDRAIDIEFWYPNAQLTASLFVPRTLYGNYLAVFP